jgi:hypothetical protein
MWRRDEATVGGVLGLTHLHILQAVLLAYTAEHVLLATLLHFARQQKLVEDEVCLLEVEDDVELAHVAVVLVHLLDIAMDNFECNQLVVGRVAARDEEERGISAIDDLGVCDLCEPSEALSLLDPLTFILQEVAHAGTAGEDELRDVFNDLGLVFGGEGGEPFS